MHLSVAVHRSLECCSTEHFSSRRISKSRSAFVRIEPHRATMLLIRLNTLHTARRAFSTSAHRLSNTVELACDSYAPSGSPRTDVGPLVLLHGLYGSKQNWRSLARGLAQRTEREVHALVRFSELCRLSELK